MVLVPKRLLYVRVMVPRIVTLGPRILRTETAALAGVSIVMYEYGDLGG